MDGDERSRSEGTDLKEADNPWIILELTADYSISFNLQGDNGGQGHGWVDYDYGHSTHSTV